jgi:hypothetical protein
MKRKEKLLRNPYIRILIVITSVLLVMSVIVFIILLGYKFLFCENPRFVLKHVYVSSSGYWDKRSNEIIKILKLETGKTNIFKITPKVLRQTLKENKIYSIENIEISRELPDTLRFDIIESISRALLYNKRANLIVDKYGILLNKKYCINIDKNLPVITGFILKRSDFISKSNKKKKILFGKKIPQIMPAIALISLMNTDYPEFNIKLINLYDPNSLTIYLPDPKKRKTIKVILPFKHSNTIPSSTSQLTQSSDKLKGKLEELKKLYEYLKPRRKEFNEINLMFDGQVIIK